MKDKNPTSPTVEQPVTGTGYAFGASGLKQGDFYNHPTPETVQPTQPTVFPGSDPGNNLGNNVSKDQPWKTEDALSTSYGRNDQIVTPVTQLPPPSGKRLVTLFGAVGGLILLTLAATAIYTYTNASNKLDKFGGSGFDETLSLNPNSISNDQTTAEKSAFNLTLNGKLTVRGSSELLSGLSVSGPSVFNGSVSGSSFIGDGSQLSNIVTDTLGGRPGSYYLNASNLSAGTLNDARLSGNVALRNANNTFTAINSFSNVITQSGSVVCDSSNNCGFSSGSGLGFIQGGNSFGGTAFLGTNDAFDLNIETSGLTRLTVEADGDVNFDSNTLFVDAANNRVGIGTTTPQGNIHIASDVEATNMLQFANNSATGPILFGRKSRGTVASPLIVASGDVLQDFRAQGYDGSTYITAARIKAEVDGTPGLNDMPSRLTFFTTPDGSTTLAERMRIDSTGNVGIGTTNPSYKLTVSGAQNLNQIVSRNSTTGGEVAVSINDTYGQIYTVSNHPLVLGTNNAERVRIDTAGNVGIGTTGPSQKLQVVGSGIFGDELAQTTGAKLTVMRTGSASGGRAFMAIENNGIRGWRWGINNTDMYFGSASDTEQLVTIQSGGNVGIGTTAPATSLHVTGAGISETGNRQIIVQSTQAYNASPTSGILFRNNFTSGGVTAGMGGIVVGKENTTDADLAGYLALSTRPAAGAVTERLRITSGGNVGIGTTGPGRRLHVVDTSNDIQAKFGDGSRDIAIEGATGAGTTEMIRLQNVGGSKMFLKGGAVAIDASGNVGIGNTSPGYLLDLYSTTPAIRVRANSTSQDPYIRLSRENSGTEVDLKTIALRGTTGSAYLALGDSTNTDALVLKAGNVGIGTTNPGAKLDLATTGAGTNLVVAQFNATQTGNAGSAILRVGTANLAHATDIEQNDGGSGPFRYGTFSDTNIVNKDLASGAYGNINFVTGSSTSASSVVMTIGGGTQKGNVGIGTTAPGYKLDIAGATINLDTGSGSSDATLRLVGRNAGTANPATIHANFNGGLVVLPEASDPTVTIGAASPGNGNTLGIVGKAAIGSTFYNSAAPTNGLLVEGNVGIGTTSPGTYHAFNGGGLEIANATSPGLILHRSASQGAARIEVNSGNDLVVNVKDGATGSIDAITILSNNGNVGIGTTTPLAKLHTLSSVAWSTASATSGQDTIHVERNVAASQGAFLGSIGFANANSGASVRREAVIAGIQTGTDEDQVGLAFFTHPTTTGGDAIQEAMRIDAGGNVGIGTAGPAMQLHVSGDGASGGGTLLLQDTRAYNVGNGAQTYFRVNTNTGVDTDIGYIGGSKENTTAGNTAGQLFFSTRPDGGAITNRMIISSTGAVRFNAYGAGTLVTDGSGNITASSDERLKDVQGNFSRGLDDILNLDPVLYKWNGTSGMETNGTYAGFTAQNVQGAIPEAVGTDPNGYLTLQDRPILAATVNAIKELNTRLTTLEGRAGLGADASFVNLNVSGHTTLTTLTVTSDATFKGKLVIEGHIIGNEDTRGEVTIAAGTTTGTYEFRSAYAMAPNIVVTPTSNPGTQYWVSDVTTTGFTITLATAPASNVTFNFQAQQ